MEKVLYVEHFSAVSNGTNKTNIPNIETVAYRFTVPNGWLYKLSKRHRALMKVSGWEKATGVDTSSDFSVTVTAPVAIVRDQDGNIRYDMMAVARGRTSGDIFPCVAYNSSTKTLTFSTTGGTSSEVVDVFYLVANGYVRFQLTAPAQATRMSTAIFTSSLSGINSKYQLSKNDALYMPFEIEAREAFSFEIAVLAPVPIILDARDIPDHSYNVNWNSVGILEIPVYVTKLVTAEAATKQNIVKRTNAQLGTPGGGAK